MRNRLETGFYLAACLAGVPDSHCAIPDIVHPAYELKTVPLPENYRTMGLGFLSDGRMVLGTASLIPPYGDVPAASEGNKVLIISGATGTAGPVQVKEIANNWMQITGITVVGDDIYVADRDAQYKILDIANSADLRGNRKKIATWPDEGTWNRGRWWHQYIFTPIFKDGFFYAPYSGSIGVAGASDVPPTSGLSGAFLKWDETGKLEAVAGGLRSPNGLNINPSGEMMVADNQGGWFPSSTFSLIKPGRFYGHRNTKPNFAESLPYQPPIAWLPHGDVRSSPSQPVYVPGGAFAGDWLIGDANNPGLVRVSIDTVNGEYQGVVFWFSRGMGTAAINRLAWGPDGALYLGTIEHYGSLPVGGPTPMYKLAAKTGVKTFEMKAVHVLKDGFEIEFTSPVDKASISAAGFALSQWQYVRVQGYGEGRASDPANAITATGTEVSEDGRRVHLKVNKLTLDRVVRFKLSGVKSAEGGAPFDTDAWYTLNRASERVWSPLSGIRDPRSALRNRCTHRMLTPGLLEVTVAGYAPDYISLRALDGTLLRKIPGSGAGRYRVEGLGARGMCILEVHGGSESFQERIFF